jgi:hypothetical protein
VIEFRSRWQIVAQSREAAWSQRVVIAGSTNADGAYELAVGSSVEVDGDGWSLLIQHNDGTGWADSLMRTRPLIEDGVRLWQVVESEDTTVGGDQDYNDYVLRVEKVGPMFEVIHRPAALNAASLEMFPDGIFVGLNGIQYMAVELQNTWGRAFHGDTVVTVSALGRQVLRSSGVEVLDAWTAEDLESTDQVLAGGGIEVGAVEVGESRTVYFKVDATGARPTTPPVQFHLYSAGGVPDISDPRRFDERKIFVAEVGFDFATNEAVARVPEGELRLELKSIVADRLGMEQVCRSLIRKRSVNASPDCASLDKLLESVRSGQCDQATLRGLLQVLCECLGDGNRDRRRPCEGHFLWFPAEFEYTIDVGGYEGQFGPLAFQDPWWKALLLSIAVVALIVAAVAALTGLGESGRPGPRIGTVGVASLNNVDAALVELDGGRTIRQSVADAIVGEPNQNAEVALDAVIPIDPQVVPANNTLIGQRVYKSGARTGLTHGIVTSVTNPIDQCRGTWIEDTQTCEADPNRLNLILRNQIEIGLDPNFNEEISDSGDSGSLWLSAEPATRNQVVGLNHSGAGGLAFANPIQDVLDVLNLRLRA